MKVYKVKVNGKVYEVELENITETSSKIETAKPVPTKAPVEKPTITSGVNKIEVKAPMQGTIVKVNVSVGDTVKKKEPVMVLEAMKLENEIVSSTDGVVQDILVKKGQSVNNQEVLLVIAQ